MLLKGSPFSEHLHYLPGRHLDLWKRPQVSLSTGLCPSNRYLVKRKQHKSATFSILLHNRGAGIRNVAYGKCFRELRKQIKVCFSHVLFHPFGITAIITVPSWRPLCCSDRFIFLSYASFWHFLLQYSQALGRDIVKLIINNTLHIETAPFWSLKPISAFWKLTQAWSKQQSINYIKKSCGPFLLSSQLPLILLP